MKVLKNYAVLVLSQENETADDLKALIQANVLDKASDKGGLDDLVKDGMKEQLAVDQDPIKFQNLINESPK